MSQPKILAFAGSLRTDSLNKKLVKLAADAARDAGAEVTLIDLKDYPMPIYDQDWEDKYGLPEHAVKLKSLMIQSDGFLLSCPEYNSSITAALKNAIDWASRRQGDEKPLVAFRGKTVALMSASPGGLGGIRSLVHVRDILGNIGMLVLADQVSIPAANKVFDAHDQLTDAHKKEAVLSLARQLVEVTAKLIAE